MRRLAVALAFAGTGAAASGVAVADARGAADEPTRWTADAALAPAERASIRVAPSAPPCALRLSDARSGRELQRLPLDPHDREVRIAFEHSVLGTTVIDRYRFTPTPVLVEEEFEGEGYGLPAMPGPGERLERVGTRQRLTLARPVDPLIVRALIGPRTRLVRPEGDLVLARLGAPSIALEAVDCAFPAR